MFKKHSDFNDYNIVNVQNDKYDGIQPDKKNIVLISQQKGWIGKGDKKLTDILEKKTNKLIFFDEIHQGASIGIEQNKLLEKYVFNNTLPKSPFIMVTATFAKPLLNYINRGDTRTKLIQWSYDNIQQMKTIHEPYNFQTFIDTIKSTDINENDGETKAAILTNLVDDLEKRGGTLEHLASQYDKYPELIVLCPGLEDTVENPQHGIPEVSELNKNSICNVIFKSTKNKFTHQDSAVDKFIQYIVKTIYDKLLKRRFKYDVFETPHSQLWFLPTPAGCRSEKKNADINNKKNEIKKKKETNADTKKLDEELKELEEYEKGTKIEHTTRLLAQAITKNKSIGDKFCVLVINSQKLPKMILDNDQDKLGGKKGTRYDELKVETYEKDSTIQCISTKCVNYKGSIMNCIQEQEACAKAKGKSLIILTGMRLRLGVSLPCVDIVLHMDPIKSVDTIYQSMFRVLTERPGKKRGYFVDLLSDRFIDFMYQYDNYTAKETKQIDIRSKRSRFIEKLFSFNINGINTYKETNDFHKIYGHLINRLNLNPDSIESFAEMVEQVQEKQLVSVLETFETKQITKYYDEIKNLNLVLAGKNPSQKKHIKETMIEPKSRENDENPILQKIINNNANNNNDIDIGEKYRLIITYIKDIFTLFVLFEAELLGKEQINTGCGSENIDEFLAFITRYKIDASNLKSVCENNKTIIECHISYINKAHLNFNETDPIKIDETVKKLNDYRNLIGTFLTDAKNHHKLEEFLNFYCNVRDKFMLVRNNPIKYAPKCEESGMTGGGRRKKTDSHTISLVNSNILTIIRDHLVVKDAEKKLFGEVFTPVELVCEMLDKLPKEVWKNPNLKWLDPANGIGNYPVVVYYKLMDSLADVKGFETESKRSKHIIENMLVMVELNPINVRVCKKIFNMIDGDCVPNVFEEDFLEWSENTDNKFDVIMGNPPYNSGGTKHTGEKNIYAIFSKQSLKMLKLDGLLLFIHPQPYRIKNYTITGVNINLNKIYTELNIKYIKILNTTETSKYFPNTQIKVDYILVQNKKFNSSFTTIIDGHNITHNIIIKPGNMIPSFGYNILDKLKQLATQNGHVTLIKTSEIHTQNSKCGKYPNIHLITKPGKRIFNSLKPHTYSNTPKLIINGLGVNYIYYDTGKYGLTEKPIIILNPSPITRVFIDSYIFKILTDSLKILGNNFPVFTQEYIPNFPSNFKTLADIEAVFDKNELELIKPKYPELTYNKNTNTIMSICKTKKNNTLKTQSSNNSPIKLKTKQIKKNNTLKPQSSNNSPIKFKKKTKKKNKRNLITNQNRKQKKEDTHDKFDLDQIGLNIKRVQEQFERDNANFDLELGINQLNEQLVIVQNAFNDPKVESAEKKRLATFEADIYQFISYLEDPLIKEAKQIKKNNTLKKSSSNKIQLKLKTKKIKKNNTLKKPSSNNPKKKASSKAKTTQVRVSKWKWQGHTFYVDKTSKKRSSDGTSYRNVYDKTQKLLGVKVGDKMNKLSWLKAPAK